MSPPVGTWGGTRSGPQPFPSRSKRTQQTGAHLWRWVSSRLCVQRGRRLARGLPCPRLLLRWPGRGGSLCPGLCRARRLSALPRRRLLPRRLLPRLRLPARCLLRRGRRLWLLRRGGRPVRLRGLGHLLRLSPVVAGRRRVLRGTGAVRCRGAGLGLLCLLGGGWCGVATGLVAAGLPWVLLGRATRLLVVAGGRGVAAVVAVVPVLAVLRIVVVLPRVLVRWLVVVVVGVLSRGSLLRGRVAAVVPYSL